MLSIGMVRRFRIALLAAAFLCLACPPARADDANVEACLTAHTSGQKARRDGKLLEAKEQFVHCAAQTCPDIVKQQCVPWLADIESRIPTVVLAVRDANGRDLANVRVTLDGTPLLSRLDGRSVPLDPGMHTFRFEAPGFAASKRSFMVRESEQGRLLRVEMKPLTKRLASTPPEPARSNFPVMAAVVGGVGVVAIGAGGYFFFDGKSDVSHLRDSCAPGCQESDVDRARTKIRVADVLLGTGIIALGVATFLALDSGGDERHARAPTTAIVF